MHFEGTRHRRREEGYKEPVFKDKVGQGAGQQVQDNGGEHKADGGAAAAAERHHMPGRASGGALNEDMISSRSTPRVRAC